ncbi:protein of unknown function [Kyrpidia spormannii]|uniref:Uncharacterized protein n=1 Tax=Kyrpidia spormannii TaxID=2055160 RepID=A0ACA8ZAQ2_9BACL|nr:protein of unknown function [Kyrpidia spormannii]
MIGSGWAIGEKPRRRAAGAVVAPSAPLQGVGPRFRSVGKVSAPGRLIRFPVTPLVRTLRAAAGTAMGIGKAGADPVGLSGKGKRPEGWPKPPPGSRNLFGPWRLIWREGILPNMCIW